MQKPKKALSAFMFYSQEMRPKLKEEHPDLPFHELAKKVAESWKNVLDKSEWEAMAEADKKRNEREEKAVYEDYSQPLRARFRAAKRTGAKDVVEGCVDEFQCKVYSLWKDAMESRSSAVCAFANQLDIGECLSKPDQVERNFIRMRTICRLLKALEDLTEVDDMT